MELTLLQEEVKVMMLNFINWQDELRSSKISMNVQIICFYLLDGLMVFQYGQEPPISCCFGILLEKVIP